MNPDYDFRQKWHEQVNRISDAITEYDLTEKGLKRMRPDTWPRFMYDAMHAHGEVKRLALWFQKERTGDMPQIHRQCSHSKPEPIIDNHLTCCLGIKCSDCKYLKGLEKAELAPEQIDEAKAWTCVTHILQNGGDVAGEGFVLTVDDRMYWDNVYQSLAGNQGEEP